MFVYFFFFAASVHEWNPYLLWLFVFAQKTKRRICCKMVQFPFQISGNCNGQQIVSVSSQLFCRRRIKRISTHFFAGKLNDERKMTASKFRHFWLRSCENFKPIRIECNFLSVASYCKLSSHFDLFMTTIEEVRRDQ